MIEFCDNVVIVGVDMNILEKFSSLISNNNKDNKNKVTNLLDKYNYSFPLSLDNMLNISSDDIKVLLSIYDSNNLDSLYDAYSLNITVIKMYKSNPNNLFFKDKYDKALIYLNNLLINLNAFYAKLDVDVSKEVIDKYSRIITKDGIKDTIANFDELDDVLDSLNLNLHDKGEIKKEIGKSNIRYANMYKENSTNNEELFNKVKEIIKLESKLIASVSKEELSSYIDGNEDEDKSVKIVSLLAGMYSEMQKASSNKDNLVLYNKSIKLIQSYIEGYNKLKEE